MGLFVLMLLGCVFVDIEIGDVCVLVGGCVVFDIFGMNIDEQFWVYLYWFVFECFIDVDDYEFVCIFILQGGVEVVIGYCCFGEKLVIVGLFGVIVVLSDF